MVDKRINLINLILESERLLYDELLVLANMNRKQLWYEINQINFMLRTLNLPEIIKDEQYLYISKDIHENNVEIIKTYYEGYKYIPKEYRSYFIKIYILTSTEMISVNHLESLLDVSRNTVLNTIKILKDSLSEKKLDLDYSREHGYQILGSEKVIRVIIEDSVHNICYSGLKEEYFKRYFSTKKIKYSVDKVSFLINQLCKKYQVEFVSERYEEFVYLFMIIANRNNKEFKINDEIIEYFDKQPLKSFSRELCNAFKLISEDEVTYFTIRLLSGIRGCEKIVDNAKLHSLTLEIINRVNVLTLGALDSSDTERLHETLYEHLVPSYYRLLYDIPLINPYTDTIKTKYLDLYTLVGRGLQPLSKLVNKSIPDDEIAYFTIHFGGYVEMCTNRNKLRAITVCPNGISSSLFLQSEIGKLFPEIEIVGVFNSDQMLDKLIVDYDMIFSTIPLISDKPVIVMKPIMNWMERDIVIKKVTNNFNVEVSQYRANVADIIDVIQRNAVIENKDRLTKELGKLIFYNQKTMEDNNLEKLLNRSLMQSTNKQLTWEESIVLASQPLLDEGFIIQSYIDAMISKVKEIGPYIVLTPLVAIPHARPEDGSKKLGISFLRSEKPIDFEFEGENKEVKLLFVLSAVDNVSHLAALQELSYLLEDQANIEKMIDEDDLDQLLEFIYQNSKED